MRDAIATAAKGSLRWAINPTSAQRLRDILVMDRFAPGVCPITPRLH